MTIFLPMIATTYSQVMGRFTKLVECIKNEIKVCAELHWSLLLGSYNRNDNCYNRTFDIQHEPPCKHHYVYYNSWIILLMG